MQVDFNNAKEDGFEPVPAGQYELYIEATEIKQTKAGTGHYLKVTYEVISEGHQGRKIFQNLNFDNPSEKATQIGLGQLKKLCRVAGVDSEGTVGIEDISSDLIGKTVKASIGIDGDYNTIKTILEPKNEKLKHPTPLEDDKIPF